MRFAKKLTVYVAATAIALVAWVLNAPQLYWMAGALILLPQASRFFAVLEHRGLEVERHLPRAGHQGEAVPVRLLARNRLPFPKLQLSLQDELPAGLAATPEGPIPIHLDPHGEDVAEYLLHLRRRGQHRLSGVRVVNSDLLDLAGVETVLPVPGDILVYPRVQPLPERVLPPLSGGGATPLDAAARQGEGSSFHGTREYRPGDPLRHVHWPTAARLARLVVVEWEAEESTDVLIAVETARGTAVPLPGGDTLDVAAALAASLAARILAGGDSLRLLVPGYRDWRPASERGSGALPGLLEALARMRDDQPRALAAALAEGGEQLTAGTVALLLTPAPDPEFLTAVRALRSARVRAVVYVLLGTPHGEESRWDGALRALASLDATVIPLYADDALVQRLLT